MSLPKGHPIHGMFGEEKFQGVLLTQRCTVKKLPSGRTMVPHGMCRWEDGTGGEFPFKPNGWLLRKVHHHHDHITTIMTTHSFQHTNLTLHS